jgi:hypothetical protein
MNELERLTEVCGGAKKTAEALKVTLRTYWHYKNGRIPEAKKDHIALLLERYDKRRAKGRRGEACDPPGPATDEAANA